MRDYDEGREIGKILGKLDEHGCVLKAQTETLAEILTQARATNGRVTELERKEEVRAAIGEHKRSGWGRLERLGIAAAMLVGALLSGHFGAHLP